MRLHSIYLIKLLERSHVCAYENVPYKVKLIILMTALSEEVHTIFFANMILIKLYKLLTLRKSCSTKSIKIVGNLKLHHAVNIG